MIENGFKKRRIHYGMLMMKMNLPQVCSDPGGLYLRAECERNRKWGEVMEFEKEIEHWVEEGEEN